MTNCLTWCWQELLERWDIYTKTNKQKFTLEMLLVDLHVLGIPTIAFLRTPFPEKSPVTPDLRNETD